MAITPCTITGFLRDPAGIAMPNATITIHADRITGSDDGAMLPVVQTTASDGSGAVAFDLLPGMYRMRWRTLDGEGYQVMLGVPMEAAANLSDLIDPAGMVVRGLEGPPGPMGALTPDDAELVRAGVDAADAAEQDRILAEAARDAADLSAAQAALYDGPWLDGVAALLADTTLTYGPGAAHVQAGSIVRTRAEGFAYEVAASGATDHHLTTAGGVKLRVLRGETGFPMPSFYVPEFGTWKKSDLQGMVAAMPGDGGRILLPKGDYLIDGSFTWSKSNIEFVGEQGTRFVMDSDGGVLMRPIGTQGSPVRNTRIRGITFFDPNPEAVGSDESHGVGAVWYDDLQIIDCDFIDLGDESVELNRGTGGRVLRSRFRNAASQSAGGGGVTISSARDSLVFGCKFLDGALGQGVRMEVAEAGLDVIDVRVIGNHFKNQMAGSAISVSPGLADVRGVLLALNQFDDCAHEAIAMTPSAGRYIYGVVIQGNIVRGGGQDAAGGGGATRAAIYASGDRIVDPVVTGNHVTGWGATPGHHGFFFTSGTLTGNYAVECADSGIVVQGSSTAIGNHAYRCGLNIASGGRAGFQFGGDSKLFANVSKENQNGCHTRSGAEGAQLVQNDFSDNVDRGLALTGPNLSTRNTIRGNGVGIALSGTDPRSIDDTLEGNTITRIDASTGGKIRATRDSDYVTVAQGEATVTSGNTFVQATHGLGETPPASAFQLTPLNDLGSAAKFWVSDIAASTFRINVDAAPGADVAFSWRADIL